MDERFVKKLLVPSCVIVFLSTTFVYELKYLVDVLFFKKKHILVIGILSSPENFQQRLSIRKTWLQLLSEVSGSAYFIIGNEICEIPPYDRIDPYSCMGRPFILPESGFTVLNYSQPVVKLLRRILCSSHFSDVTSQTEFTTMKIRNQDKNPKTSTPSFIGFGFYVRSTIVVTKLGILRELLLLLNTEIQVKLFSAFDNRVLASVTFNSDLLNENTLPVVTKAIKPVKLYQKFEAFVKLETKNLAYHFFPKCDFAAWQSDPNVINFIHLWQENSVMPHPFTEKSCTFLFMSYTILDPESIIQHNNNRTLRFKEWQRHNRKLSFKLESESKLYNDILLVNVIDVYRNLSLKMIHFYKRIVKTEYFHYVLKADDDSFIDLLRVHDQLKAVNKEIDYEISQAVGKVKETGIVTKLRMSKFWWWSFFKEFWKVQRSGKKVKSKGKWREDQYRSASYPTFPCGGGYVLNKGIVDYITANDNHFHHFQGEDVSLGIWLSTLPVIYYKTSKDLDKSNSHHLQEKVITKFVGKRAWILFKLNKTSTKLAPDLCEWTCNNKKYLAVPLCNKVQLNIPTMYATWKDYIRKGYL